MGKAIDLTGQKFGRLDKKRINLGTYDRIEEALEARKTAEEKYWK